jgi:hypothetical protein
MRTPLRPLETPYNDMWLNNGNLALPCPSYSLTTCAGRKLVHHPSHASVLCARNARPPKLSSFPRCRSTVCDNPADCRLCKNTLIKRCGTAHVKKNFKNRYRGTETILPYCKSPIICRPVADAQMGAPPFECVSHIRVSGSLFSNPCLHNDAHRSYPSGLTAPSRCRAAQLSMSSIPLTPATAHPSGISRTQLTQA